MVYSINSDGPDFRAIVTGAIGDYGPAVTVFPDGKVDPSHTHDLELKLTHGSFKLSITELDQRFVAVTSHEPIYPRTCSDYMTASAPMAIVPGFGYRRVPAGSAAASPSRSPPTRWRRSPASRSGRSSGRPSCCAAPAA